MWEFVDKVVYINLDSRPDRRVRMEQIVKTFGDKATRFPAIKETPGAIGCTKSHIAVLRRAIEEKWGNIIIIEDDIEWNNFDHGYAKLETIAKTEFDCIVLGGSCIHYDQKTSKLYNGQTTTGYLVNSKYISTLLSNYEEGLQKLQKEPHLHSLYAIDVYWTHLHSRDNWYVIMPCLVYQRPDHSDIENKFVDYRTHMNLGYPVPPPISKKSRSLLPFLNIR
jgi:glycosyl transferase family 25